MATREQNGGQQQTSRGGGAPTPSQRGMQGGSATGGGATGAQDERARGLSARGGRDLRRGGFGGPSFAQQPFQMMMRLSDEMNRIFDSVFGREFGRGFAPAALGSEREAASLWSPQIEMRQRGNEFIVRADLPGVPRESINIEIAEGQLILSGERRAEQESDEQGWHRSERSYGSFYRAIPLPEGAKADDVKATSREGVLEIVIPVEAQPRGRRIEIQGN